MTCRPQILAGIIFTFSFSSYEQTILDIPLRDVRRQSPDVLLELEKQHPVKMFFLTDWLSQYQVDEHFGGYAIKSMLDELLSGSGIKF